MMDGSVKELHPTSAAPHAADTTGRQFAVFVAIGATAALGFIVLSSTLVRLHTGLADWLVSAGCYALFVVPVYLLHRRLSFQSDARHRQAFPRYAIVQLCGLILASLFSYLAYGVLAMPTIAASLLVIALTSGVNFVALRLWAFREADVTINSVLAPFKPKTILNAAHDKVVFGRRVGVLSSHLAKAIPEGGRVLDLGCGDGSIALALMGLRDDLAIEGVDVLIRPKTHIPVTRFDGGALPFEDKSFDYVTVVDVLHHTEAPAAVLAEACRVARKGIIIKDHLLDGWLAGPTLRLMDWVGNRGHDVVLPYNYLTRDAWAAAFSEAGCSVTTWDENLHLYPRPASMLFDRHLHFVALMKPLHAAGV